MRQTQKEREGIPPLGPFTWEGTFFPDPTWGGRSDSTWSPDNSGEPQPFLFVLSLLKFSLQNNSNSEFFYTFEVHGKRH